MNIKKAMKVFKAARRLKKYCTENTFCKGCMFYDENSMHTETCMIRRNNPDEYDLDKISKGVYLNDTQKGT